MDAIIQQGILGIVTGIITAAALLGIKLFWTRKVTPFLISTRYQGVQIDGQWHGLSEITQEQADATDGKEKPYRAEFNLFLEQNAHSLTGTFIFKFNDPTKDFTLDFKVVGYIWEGYVTLNFTPKDRRITSYGTTLLKLHDGGQSLIGSWLFRDVEKEIVNQAVLVLVRSNQKS